MFEVKDKNVLVVGLAQSGVSLVKLLTKLGAAVTVTDSKSEKDLGEYLADLAPYKVTLDLGGHTPKYLQSADLVILSPGVPTDLKALEPAKLKGTPITGELEFASQYIKEPIMAITGTNGKSTVTKLAHEFLTASGLKAWIGGNFGTPLSEYVLAGEKADVLVVEVSSFQLETVSTFNPQQIALLNMAEDHLDRYKSMADYMTAKKRLFKNATRDVHAYLSADDSLVIEMAKDPFVQKARIHYFSTRVAYAEQIKKIGGAYHHEREIELINSVTGQTHRYSTARIKMRGKHSLENMLAALCLVHHYDVKPEAVQKVIDTFPGLEHRLEYIRTKGGVQFYNDSKATNVHAVMRALDTFDEPMILIAGGKDKGIDFMPATDLIAAKVKNLILIGEAKERLNRTLGDYSETFIIGTFEEAVLLAYQKSRSGDVILLSPGCSSYDMFKDYEARGNYFKDLIKKL